MKKTKRSYQTKKAQVAALQNGWYCLYCWTPASLCIEHVVPVARGGTEELSNLVLSCQRCNSRKLHYSVEQMRENGHDYIARRVELLLRYRGGWDIKEIEKRLENSVISPDPPRESVPSPRSLLSDYQTPLSRKIHEALVERCISRHQVRRNLGLSGWTVDRWCTGEAQPRPDNLLRLSRYLGISVTEFLPYVKKHRYYSQMDDASQSLIDALWERGLSLLAGGLMCETSNGIPRLRLVNRETFLSSLPDASLLTDILLPMKSKMKRRKKRSLRRKKHIISGVEKYIEVHRIALHLHLYELGAHCSLSSWYFCYLVRSQKIEKDPILMERLESLFGVKFIASEWK